MARGKAKTSSESTGTRKSSRETSKSPKLQEANDHAKEIEANKRKRGGKKANSVAKGRAKKTKHSSGIDGLSSSSEDVSVPFVSTIEDAPTEFVRFPSYFDRFRRKEKMGRRTIFAKTLDTLPIFIGVQCSEPLR